MIYGVGCVLGTYCVGEWATRRAAHNERLQLTGLAIMLSVSGVFGTFVFLPSLAPNYYWAFAWLGLSSITGMINGPAFAVLQTVIPESMRATAIALINLFANLIGMGLGPWVAGMLSDAFRPWAGDESLRYALLAISPGYFWVAWHLWQASKTVSHDLEGVQCVQERAVPQERRSLETGP